jgi:nucleoid DNA-binding protein
MMAAPAHSERPATKAELAGAIARKSKVSEEDINKVLEALGPVIRDRLSNGETVEIAGLGTFRVVRIPEHKDMVKGRPATIEATNSVEFVPFAACVDAVNGPNAVPAVTVPQFEYNPLPDQTKSQRAPYQRAPNVRTP